MSNWAPHPLTLRQLQYVVAVAETRSFRRAAERCRVAQPSLSTQLAQAERALGVRLLAERFERYLGGLHESRRGAEKLGDTDTVDLFTQLITELEKNAWFLRASLDV